MIKNKKVDTNVIESLKNEITLEEKKELIEALFVFSEKGYKESINIQSNKGSIILDIKGLILGEILLKFFLEKLKLKGVIDYERDKNVNNTSIYIPGTGYYEPRFGSVHFLIKYKKQKWSKHGLIEIGYPINYKIYNISHQKYFDENIKNKGEKNIEEHLNMINEIIDNFLKMIKEYFIYYNDFINTLYSTERNVLQLHSPTHGPTGIRLYSIEIKEKDKIKDIHFYISSGSGNIKMYKINIV